jgi:hypothetical protein
MNVAHGKPIYSNPEALPLEVFQYTPLSQIPIICYAYLLDDTSPFYLYWITVLGRLTALAANCITAWLIYRLLKVVFQIPSNLAFAGGIMVLASFTHAAFAVRPDALTLLVTTWISIGFFRAIHSDKQRNLIVFSFLTAFAVLFKQDAFFLLVPADAPDYELHFNNLRMFPKAILCLVCTHDNYTQVIRRYRLNLAKYNIPNPVILQKTDGHKDIEEFQIHASSELGCQLIDGFGDGIWVKGVVPQTVINSTAFGILQATRTRISKTEYISCPSCGRTLFDLQETTAKIRKETSHLKGIKIGIMGCIVNGPGEMADADYGYVGTGPGKINLYKEKSVVRKNVAEEEAVTALIDLIKEHGDWVEPKA